MPKLSRLTLACLAAVLPGTIFCADGNVPRGRRLFANQCASCHAATAENRLTGPSLLGVVGRKAGSLDGFAFSEGIKKSALTWDAATLDRYLAAPAQVVPGTTMAFAVSSASARADLIRYLDTLKAAPATPPSPAPEK